MRFPEEITNIKFVFENVIFCPIIEIDWSKLRYIDQDDGGASPQLRGGVTQQQHKTTAVKTKCRRPRSPAWQTAPPDAGARLPSGQTELFRPH